MGTRARLGKVQRGTMRGVGSLSQPRIASCLATVNGPVAFRNEAQGYYCDL